MESKRLIPYSVHLREDIYLKLKEAAQDRKATALVRDAITMMIEGNDEFNAGYNKAIRDVISAVHDDELCSRLGYQGETIACYLEDILTSMIVHQRPNRKKK
jgi:hypothetical protein